jgi:MYXO-CTERM domain-containing protein
MRRREVLQGAGAVVGTAGLAGIMSGARGTGTTAEPYAPLGRVQIRGSAETVVGDEGTIAYVAATEGFAAVDVSDPAAPTVLAERRELREDTEAGTMQQIYDVKVDGDRLLVAGPAQPGTSGSKGVLVYDVSDPADPVKQGFYGTDHYVHNCYLDGDVAYVCNGSYGQEIEIVDVAADEPTKLAEWTPIDHEPRLEEVPRSSLTVHDVYVHDDRAYLPAWDTGTYVLDVSDPAEPTYVTSVSDYTVEEMTDLGRVDVLIPPGNHHYARPSDDGSLLFVGRESWSYEPEGKSAVGGPGGITIYDLSGSGEPTELSTIEPHPARDETYRSGTWTTSHNFDLVGDRLYTSWYQGGVKLFDVSDPATPEQLAWWRNHEDAAFWTAQAAGNDAFVASTHTVPSQFAPFEGLFTFPDRAGEQEDPPSIPTETPTPGETTPTDTPTPTATPTDSPTPTATPTDSPTPTANRVMGDGFGVLAGLAALGGAAWWRRRSRAGSNGAPDDG